MKMAINVPNSEIVLNPRLIMICLTSPIVIAPRISELTMIRTAKMTRL